uniref:SP-RING-type domain-containing protein n=1 Tax=Trichobilharzia regenti TaxID=157069 RepID=A0AA85JHB0_TRIRE|nr:unnamed protein product [Trichobilharzia regenti]
MRPACAYPPILQTNIANGPDLYRERETFNYGVANSQSLPMQAMSSNQPMYHSSASATGLNCPTSAMSPQPQMQSQQSHFQIQQYPQIQQSYNDMMSSSQVSSFQTQQQQYPTMVVNPNMDKIVPQNIPTSESSPNLNYTRNTNSNGPLSHSQMISNTAMPSYGLVSTPNSSAVGPHQQRTTHISMGNQSNVNRSMSQTQHASSRSPATRAVSSESATTYQSSSLYLPYSAECSVSQPGPGVALHYSSSIPTCSSVPQIINNSLPPGSSCPGQSPRQPTGCRTQVPINVPSSTPGMQQQQMYNSRPLNNSNVYSGSGYGSQQYSQPSPAFRPSPNAVNSQTVAPIVTRSTTPRDVQGNACLTMHHSLSQQQSQQSTISLCPSNSSQMLGTGSVPPNARATGSCSVSGAPGSAFNHSCTPTGHAIPTALGNGQTVVPNSSTPPCALPTNNSRSLGPQVNSVNSGVGDLCYMPSRPISSGGRDVVMTSVSINGPLSSGGDMLLNSNFHVSSGLNPLTSSASFTGNNSQMSGLQSDFDGSVPNSSPLMMMTMPVSSPIPGNLINGPMHANVMNVGMASSAPAPPPYHHPASMLPCRSVGPSFFNPTSMAMPPITVTSTAHMNTTPTFSSVPDQCNVTDSDRSMFGIIGENVIGNSVNSKQTSGANKTARPKRVRGSKTSSGVGRGSRVNSKKSLAANTIPSVSSSEPFSPNQRVVSQQPKKVQSWNTGSSGNMNFNPTMLSPNQSAGMPMVNSSFIGGGDSRDSPVTFTSQAGNNCMRPNSGPPVNNSNSTGATGMGYESVNCLDSQSNHSVRVPVSPRHGYCSSQVPVQQQQQQQQYPVPNTVSNCNYTANQSSGAFYSQVNQHTSNMNASQTQSNQMCYPNNGTSNSQRTPPNVHFQPQSVQANSHPQSISSPMTTNCSRVSAPTNFNTQNYPSSVAGPYTYADRLVCPITNGMVWGPTQIQLNDIMHQYLPEGIYLRRFEFDLTANHLNTIVGRTDLDIVVCSHLLSEPLQVCHWPPDAVQIRFNDYLLRLDRSSVNGGQPAHKVACVKQLCRPGRNQLEIAILGLGEDPNQPSTMAKRRATAQTLEAHRFAAFMAHMPALNVLLDGLQRRRPAGVNTLCDILEGRIGTRSLNEDGCSTQNMPSGPSQSPVIAELNLICPVFRTRMRIPGRIAGCQHIEAFDMEAFLRREVLWPRLNCPICGHKSPAGLDGLCIDTTILYALQLVPQSTESILVRSDGYWRLVPPLSLDLPFDADQWQPLIGPLTETVTQAFSQLCTKASQRGQQSQGNGGVRQTSTICHTSAPDWNRSPVQRISPQQQQQPKVTSISHGKSQSTNQTAKVVTSLSQDITNSPQWISESCSPSNQTNLENTSSTVSYGPGELIDSAYSSAASRPASQPVSWVGTQSSPDKMSASTSLPSSPSLSTRTSSSCFSIAAIPGVNMCVVDSVSSASNLPNSTTCTTTMTKSFLSTCVSSGVTVEQSIDIGNDNNPVKRPSSNHISTDEVSSSTSGIGVSTSEYCSPSNASLETSNNSVSTNSSRRCPTSSLNMGLDFLLTEDQTIPSTAISSGERSPQMSSAVVSAAVRSVLTTTSDTECSLPTTTSSLAVNSEEFTLTTISSITKSSDTPLNENPTSPKSEDIIYSKCEQQIDCTENCILPSSYSNQEEKCTPGTQLTNSELKVENDTIIKRNIEETNEETTTPLHDEISMPVKRIKLESPQFSPQVSLHSSVASTTTTTTTTIVTTTASIAATPPPSTTAATIPIEEATHLPEKHEDVAINEKSDEVLSMITTTNTVSNNEMFEVKKTLSVYSNDTDHHSNCISLISSDFDEEKVSIELIHSISSKIDHLDLFLDESYIHFVEHFPCV